MEILDSNPFAVDGLTLYNLSVIIVDNVVESWEAGLPVVSKSNKYINPPAINEEWWAALLAEEEKHGKSPQREPVQNSPESTNGKSDEESIPPSNMIDIDWEFAQQLYNDDNSIDMEVTGFNRGGLLVGVGGLHGFVPISHLVDLTGDIDDPEREVLLGNYLGRHICLKVIECDEERGRVVFSERAAQAGAGRRNELFDGLRNGDQITGIVTNITDFGIFLDLGGVEGLIHVSELSWGRVRHPNDVATIGEKLNAYVISIDRARCRIALSLKRLHPNPWETAEERYRMGQIVDVVVTSVVPFGAFARLETGLDGLIHKSEFGKANENKSPSELLKEGQHIRVRILNVDPSKQRLGLSLNLTEE
jgi:small subunit ribosomal protein S1